MRGSVGEAPAEPRLPLPSKPGPSGAGIFEVRSGDGVVILDLFEDEYSCRYEAEQPISRYRPVAPASNTDANSARALPEARWIRQENSDPAQLALRDILRFGGSLLSAMIRFRGRTLRELADLAKSLRTTPPGHRRPPRQVADLFQQMLIWTPLRPKCLFGSFFLLHFLNLYGIRADWVFGVQLFPFRAHCWLAIDDELLNEVPHGIEDYRVIWTVDSSQE